MTDSAPEGPSTTTLAEPANGAGMKIRKEEVARLMLDVVENGKNMGKLVHVRGAQS